MNPRLFAAADKRGQVVWVVNPARPRAKRVIYLFMSGAPSHIDLFDHKPKLAELTGTELPASVRGGQRITGMTSGQAQLLCVGSPFKFGKFGKNGTELLELLPHLSKVVDEIAVVRSMFTEPINHDPAVTFIGTGNQQPGRPTVGAWVSYGLGSENKNLPSFVLLSGGGGQPLQARYWGNGFAQRIRACNSAARATRSYLFPIRRASANRPGGNCSMASGN